MITNQFLWHIKDFNRFLSFLIVCKHSVQRVKPFGTVLYFNQ